MASSVSPPATANLLHTFYTVSRTLFRKNEGRHISWHNLIMFNYFDFFELTLNLPLRFFNLSQKAHKLPIHILFKICNTCIVKKHVAVISTDQDFFVVCPKFIQKKNLSTYEVNCTNCTIQYKLYV